MSNSHLISCSLYSWGSDGVIRCIITDGDSKLAAGLLLGYVLLGLACFTWTFWWHRGKLKDVKKSIILFCSCRQGSLRGVQHIHNSVSALVFMDLLNAITAIVLAVQLLSSPSVNDRTIVHVFNVWFLSKWFLEALHLLNALMSIILLCQLRTDTNLRLIAAAVGFFLVVLCFLYMSAITYGTYLHAIIIFGLVLAIIAKSTVPVSPPPSTARKIPIISVAMITFLLGYIPKFVIECFVKISKHEYWDTANKHALVYGEALFIINIQLIMDGLLCFFILKLHAGDQQRQQNLSNIVSIRVSSQSAIVEVAQH